LPEHFLNTCPLNKDFRLLCLFEVGIVQHLVKLPKRIVQLLTGTLHTITPLLGSAFRLLSVLSLVVHTSSIGWTAVNLGGYPLIHDVVTIL
jgi:hypothetical protein